MKISLLLQLTLFFCFFNQDTSAQNSREAHQKEFQINISKTNEPVKIDGELSEKVWENASKASNFWLKWPRDGELAQCQSSIQITYDDVNLYIAATCYDTGAYIIPSLKRDAQYWSSDGLAVVIDPANRATNGYLFGVTPAGVQSDALLTSNSDDDTDFTWDNKWRAETKIYPDRWTAEYAIPFRILRFKEDATHWGINFIRSDASNGHWSTWAKIPLQFDGTDLGWTGMLNWDAPPHRSKGNTAFIPYLTNSVSKNYEDQENWKAKPNAGLDAKIGIGSALNLDVTLNPDFSQVEIDEQVINLTRFNIQLPEKRTFFLENADIFGGFGIPPIRPFFSRKIGLDADGNAVPILYGLRLTGNLNNDTRIGALNMHTQNNNGTDQNYSAVSLRRRLFGRTQLNGYFLNRQGFEKREMLNGDYARNAGGEFAYTSNSGKWGSWVTWHQAFAKGINEKGGWGDAGMNYNGRKFNFVVDLLSMGVNYEADLGFETRIRNYDALRDTTIRIGYNHAFVQGSYRFFPKNKNSRYNFTRLESENYTVFNKDNSLNEHNSVLNYNISLKNTSFIGIGASYVLANVPVSFKFDDKDNAECPPIPASQYRFSGLNAGYESDSRKRLTYSLNVSSGGFYNGKSNSASASFNYRAQPWGNLRLKLEYNDLNFPEPYCDVAFFAITPRVEIFFNRNLNWTTFLQYNTQADNFNINSRIQWRYRPMSDVFLVYTDNYTVQVWGPKNRAIVAKVNYWL